MRWPAISSALEQSLRDGLSAAAVLSPEGQPLGYTGDIEHHEVRALAALVSRTGPPDILARLFDGEIVGASYGDRAVLLAIAGRCVFVVAIAGADESEALAAVRALRSELELVIRDARGVEPIGWHPPTPGSSGSGSPAAEAFVFPPGRDRSRKPN